MRKIPVPVTCIICGETFESYSTNPARCCKNPDCRKKYHALASRKWREKHTEKSRIVQKKGNKYQQIKLLIDEIDSKTNALKNIIDTIPHNGCLCQQCNKYYTVDVNVPDKLWNKISRGKNLLCPDCIIKNIVEYHKNQYAVYHLNNQ